MCGISGIFSFEENVEQYYPAVQQSIMALRNRGPEVQQVEIHGNTILAHARLAILDTSSAGNQPFTDATGRYTIVYNGECYNYRDFYHELREDGVVFTSSTDTEVLLQLYIKYGKQCLHYLNVFFAFAIYDAVEKSLFVARDKMGIKPLYITQTEHFFAFSSELKGLTSLPISRTLNREALTAYLQLTYVPAPLTMLEGVEKLEPGMCLMVTTSGIKKERYFTLPRYEKQPCTLAYDAAQKKLVELLTDSVNKRLIADVPLGTFLSGGIDSSIISTLASRSADNLQTFSVGFKDNPFIDETYYARLVAKKIHSQHTEIQIDNAMLEDALMAILNNIDEPFADSSAIAVHVLCKYVKPSVTVALSGDGADELFAGYRKHFALEKQIHNRLLNRCLSVTYPIIKHLPQSRSNSVTNLFRKVVKYAKTADLSTVESYWNLCCFIDSQNVVDELRDEISSLDELQSHYLSHFTKQSDLNDILYADQLLVLPNDMLTKTDRMSMDNSLEVRTPFLDIDIVAFANSLPVDYKLQGNMKKRILQDAFRNDLPIELYNRPKQGFEVPLQSWCHTILKELSEDLLSPQFVEEQGIFNVTTIENLKRQTTMTNPKDAPMQLWTLLVFQAWWKREMSR